MGCHPHAFDSGLSVSRVPYKQHPQVRYFPPTCFLGEGIVMGSTDWGFGRWLFSGDVILGAA